ncbi:MAG: DUF4340 domain-containing protein [Pseudomonadota bacterium]|nr:DUF4340 domain-containing protein [Pseudomonadota bacterium]
MSVIGARLRLNAILLAVLSVLVFVVISEPGKQEEAPRPTISSIAPKSVNSIRIARPGGENVELHKEGGHWLLKQPFSVRADEPRVQALLDFLEDESQDAFPAKDHDLKRFGLAEPAIRLQVDDSLFTFGDANPLSGRRYVLHEDTIHLAADTIYPALTVSAEELATPRLLQEGTEPVKLTLPKYVLSRGAKGHWKLSPPDPRISSAALQKLVDEWRYAQALAVRRKQERTSQGTIRIEFRAGTPVQFEILAKNPEFILARSDLELEYAMPAETGQRLLEPQKATKPPAAAKSTPASPEKPLTPRQ